MNRTLIGVLLLIALPVTGIFSSLGMTRWNGEIAGQLDTAARLALEKDPESASQTLLDAQTRWQELWSANAAFTDHAPLEQIDAGFAQLRIYAQAGEAVAFAAVCAQLAQQIRAIGEAGSASWRNIL